MSIVLKHQVEASEKAAADLAIELRQQHRRAMLCYDVQDLMRSVIDLHAGLNRDVHRWQNTIAAAKASGAEGPEDVGSEWEALYRRLGSVFDQTAQLVRSLEGDGFSLDGRPEFLDSWRDLRATLSFSLERVAAGVEQIRRGEGRKLEDVLAELGDELNA